MGIIRIAYPNQKFSIQREHGVEKIFDTVRKAWVVLTPEEWVRQNLLQYMVQVLHYPAKLIAVEKELLLGDRKRRFDILVYGSNQQPWMLVECKSEYVSMDESVMSQALAYASGIHCPYMVVSNGNQTMGWERSEGRLMELKTLPEWRVDFI